MTDIEPSAEARQRAAPALERLAALGVAAETHWHRPHFTVEESRADRGDSKGHTKNLFLKDKKSRYFLVTVRDDAELDLKGLHRHIGAQGRLSFGSAEKMEALLGVTPGSVTALAAFNASPDDVRFVIDEALLAANLVHCHPLTNEATTSLRPADLMSVMKACGHDPLILNVEDASPL
ncbi:prolyl-tRNA synthetase associated domain-containing protein [Notoacmeibacter sp. MSK16QG-6]|uniref:prolyl-tRNA synthetase associated domain-containing protein n=1 Tax=Notoacmeibacter sp. MSK16QG-6 TaxID=2957982 RepID=UPI00209FF20D|nr:prolyl-tRNA synthetase associated domain-containing protein [Notoacmeibacter sp. MSK16QG-6]MCP1199122.1 prolyl-tRNA synthetase associated domain-containing protein [Notoacmeibacter sp. MSK16QG-6]